MPSRPEGERETHISRHIAFVLMHEARRCGIPQDEKGWVALSDLRQYGALENVEVPKLMDVMNQSNLEKPRFQISEDGYVRAYDQWERKNMAVGWNIFAAAASAPSAAAAASAWPPKNLPIAPPKNTAQTQHLGQHRYQPYVSPCVGPAAAYAAKRHDEMYAAKLPIEKLPMQMRAEPIEKLPKLRRAEPIEKWPEKQMRAEPIEKLPEEQTERRWCRRCRAAAAASAGNRREAHGLQGEADEGANRRRGLGR